MNEDEEDKIETFKGGRKRRVSKKRSMKKRKGKKSVMKKRVKKQTNRRQYQTYRRRRGGSAGSQLGLP